MDRGRCYSCASLYGVLRQEVGCKNCGFSFCTKCVTKKAVVKKWNNEVHRVCDKCYATLTRDPTVPVPPRPISPPANFLKRLQQQQVTASKEHHAVKPTAPAAHPHLAARPLPQTSLAATSGVGNSGSAAAATAAAADALVAAPSDPDQLLMQRLLRLKEDQSVTRVAAPAPPSDDAIRSRLAALQGRTYDPAASEAASRPKVYPRKTDAQMTDELLDEICSEVSIETRHFPADDREELPLAEADSQPSTSVGLCQDLDSDVSKLIARVAEELHLDKHRAAAAVAADEELLARLLALRGQHSQQQLPRDVTFKGGRSVAVRSSATDADIKAERSDHRGDSSSDEDEENVKRVLKQVLEEKLIDEAVTAEGYASLIQSTKANSEDNESSRHEGQEADELPWCCLCNDDANLRCPECEDDLYCQVCFRKAHDEFELREHKPTPYRKHETNNVPTVCNSQLMSKT